MDYTKNAKRETVDGRELMFIRCDSRGNEIPAESLSALNLTNMTIEKIVTEVAGRLEGGGEFSGSIGTI